MYKHLTDSTSKEWQETAGSIITKLVDEFNTYSNDPFAASISFALAALYASNGMLSQTQAGVERKLAKQRMLLTLEQMIDNAYAQQKGNIDKGISNE